MLNPNIALFPLVVVMLILLNSCAQKEIFRNSTPTEYRLSQEDLRLVQYYITSDVVLSRTEKKKETGVTGSNILRTEESIYSKEIIIDKATEGAAMKVSPNRLTIAFDRGLVLDFEPRDSEPQTPYTLTALNGTSIAKSGETVMYHDRDYVATYGKLPMLNYKFTNKLNEKRDKETAKGMTVEDMFRLEKELESKTEDKQGTQQKIAAPLEVRNDIPLNKRKLVRFILTTGQKIEAYLIADSEDSYFVSPDIDPKNRPARIRKSMVASSDLDTR